MSSLRIVFLADTHLGFDYPVKPRIQRRRRGSDFFDNFHKVLAYARQTRPHLVVHGGDLFFRARIPHKIVAMVYEILFDFAQEGIPILIVPGNHERSILPASLFLNHPNIYIYDRPTTFTFDWDNVTASLSGFPCQRSSVRDKFSGLLSQSGWHDQTAGLKLLCLHQTVEGAQVGPSGYTFRDGEDVIPLKALPPDAAAILAGHIHRRQILGGNEGKGSWTPPVIYPGSIERTSFAERDERKGFYELQFSQPGSGVWRVERMNFIDLPTRPMEDLYLDGSVTADTLRDVIQESVSQMAEDAILRFKCSPDLDPLVRSRMTAAFLRSVLPESMNYQFAADFHQPSSGS